MGHHPYETILELGKLRLNDMFNDLKYHMYVSSHTHYGWIKKHQTLGKDTLSELNVGSVTDWGTKGSQTVYLNNAVKGSGDQITIPIKFNTNHMKTNPPIFKNFAKKSGMLQMTQMKNMVIWLTQKQDGSPLLLMIEPSIF